MTLYEGPLLLFKSLSDKVEDGEVSIDSLCVDEVEGIMSEKDLVAVTAAAWDSLTDEVIRLRKLLYTAIVELQYVQDAEDLSQCASSKGKQIIERGMELLGVRDLAHEEEFGIK